MQSLVAPENAQIVRIFGAIGEEATVETLSWELDRLDRSAPLHVVINSPGGYLSEGITMLNLLRSWPSGTTVEIVGWALSAATLIAMAGKRISIHASALMMVHAPSNHTGGNSTELRQWAETLDVMTEAMIAAYRRTGQSEATIRGWLDDKDHWFLAEEAVAVGLADEVIQMGEREPAAALSPAQIAACRFSIPSSIQRILATMSTPNTTPRNAPQNPAAGAAAQAELLRRDAIRAAFDAHLERPGLLAVLRAAEQDQSCDIVKAKGMLLDALSVGASSAAGHYVVSVDEGSDRMRDFNAAATDVLLARGGIKVAEPHPAARDLQRLSVVAMAERVLSMLGKSTRNLSNAEIVAMGMGTSDFPALLANVSGKALRSGYENAPATFAGWTGEREVSDFKTQTLAAMSEAPGLLKVPEGGEYKFGKFDDSASTFKLDTYGRIINITRQALVNDDLGAFTQLPMAFGAGARRLEADMVYSTLTSTANLADGLPLFHASRGNLAGAAAPSVASLGAARAAMRKQKGIQGLGFLDPQPRYLIVPVALETLAEQLLASLVDPSKSNSTPQLEWIRGLTLVSDPRLDEVSATAWYLAAAPEQINGIVRAYLAGEQRPHLEENAEFIRDAISFKSRLDLGVGVIDFRGLYKTA